MTEESTPLESGYGPGVPSADNVLNDFVQESGTSFEAFACARGDRTERHDGLVSMCDAGSRVPFFNRASLAQPIDDLDRLLSVLRSFYQPVGHDAPFLLDSSWPTPDLRPHGYVLMGHPPLMVRPADQPLPAAPPELRVQRVEDARTAYDFEHVLVYGYPTPQMQPMNEVTMFTDGARTAPGWHHFVGYVGDAPVAAGSSYGGERLLRVDNIATLESARGKGYGLAITAAAIGVDPTKPATLIASDLGRPIYERLGFMAMLRVTYWLGLR